MTNCLECQNLSRVYESKLTRYLAARSAVLYRISTEFAAKQQVRYGTREERYGRPPVDPPFATK
jgi:hypothetical protein